LLLGLLREDRQMLARFTSTPEGVAGIRQEIEKHTTSAPKVSPAIDLPLTPECKRALQYAVEEAERQAHRAISTVHLMLGLLREENSIAAKILRDRGVDLAVAREKLANSGGSSYESRSQSGYRYLHLDVFTDTFFAGNQLAVFLHPLGLTSE